MTGSDSAAGKNSVRLTRVFDAPRDVVFRFWMKPEFVAQWWGPDGYTAPREDITIEPHAGGRYELRMVESATGAYVWMHGTIVELVEPELLVVHMDVPHPIGLPPLDARLRVQFQDQGEKTLVTLYQGPFATSEQLEQTTAGWNFSLTRLNRLAAEDHIG